MSKPVVRKTYYDDPVDAELAMWPGVMFAREAGGKHLALVLTFAGQTRRVFYPSSPSDKRGALNNIQNVRATLKALGAVRKVNPKAAVKRVKRQRVERDPLSHVAPAPSRESPWAALSAVTFAPPPPRLSGWQRIRSRIASIFRRAA